MESIDRIRSGNNIEDDRIELKRNWPEPSTKARQLAGAANKSNGDELIYIIGVDEKTGEVHAHHDTDPATWWAQMSSRFDEVGPDLIHHINVPLGSGESVAALLFSTDRAPYLVKVEGGNTEREIPFRDGTRTRSARRAELLRLLMPQAAVPPAMLLSAWVHADWYAATNQPRPASIEFSGSATIFLEHISSTSILLPVHESSAVLSSAEFNLEMEMRFLDPMKDSPPPPIFGVHSRFDGVVATGPGTFSCRFSASLPEYRREELQRNEAPWRLSLSFGVAGSSRQVQMDCELADAPSTFPFQSETQARIGQWSFGS
ncbi:MAG: hypothetical protein JWP70_1299 [Leifsonia sp.]|nr:hypothetical protein [Leifsonia sp.]